MTTEAARAFGAALFIGGLILAAALLATAASSKPEPATSEATPTFLGFRSGADPVYCVEFAGNAQAESGMSEEEVVNAMDAGFKLVPPIWRQGLDLPEDYRYAEYGCPSPAPLECLHDVPVQCLAAAEHVAYPSRYHLFFYVLTQNDFEAATGISLGYYFGRTGPAEMSCVGDLCDGLTLRAYLTIDELRDPSGLAHAMRIALGLEGESEIGEMRTAYPTVTPHPVE